MRHKRIKWRDTVIIFGGTIILLAGCSSGTGSNSGNSAETPKEQVPENKALVLSEALPEYKIWYVIRTDNEPVSKTDTPSYAYYFDGENTENYSLYAYPHESQLKISELLDMSEEEQLEYFRKVDESMPNETYGGHNNVTVPYHINIVTDDSGNFTDYEEFTISYNSYNISGEIFFNTDQRGDIRTLPTGYTAQIYDHTLAGYTVSDGYLFLTDIGDDLVNFGLDSPEDESELISVDGDLERVYYD